MHTCACACTSTCARCIAVPGACVFGIASSTIRSKTPSFADCASATFAPRLLQVEGERIYRVREVPVASSSLHEGGVFVLDTGRTLYQWHGSAAAFKERACALDYCRAIRELRAETQQMPVKHLLLRSPSCASIVARAGRAWLGLG